MIFDLDRLPLTNVTPRALDPSTSSRKLTTSSFALPSTGGAPTRTPNSSPSRLVIPDCLAPGVARSVIRQRTDDESSRAMVPPADFAGLEDRFDAPEAEEDAALPTTDNHCGNVGWSGAAGGAAAPDEWACCPRPEDVDLLLMEIR